MGCGPHPAPQTPPPSPPLTQAPTSCPPLNPAVAPKCGDSVGSPRSSAGAPCSSQRHSSCARQLPPRRDRGAVAGSSLWESPRSLLCRYGHGQTSTPDTHLYPLDTHMPTTSLLRLGRPPVLSITPQTPNYSLSNTDTLYPRQCLKHPGVPVSQISPLWGQGGGHVHSPW